MGDAYPGYQVPLDRWANLVFQHDGLDGMKLYADGEVEAVRTQVLSGVRPVGPLGVSIGNAVEKPQPLNGDIDEIKEFLSFRPTPRPPSRKRPG